MKTAKDINLNNIPKIMRKAGTNVDPKDVSESFADFFDNKVKNIVNSCVVDENVNNGRIIIHNNNNKNFVNHNAYGQ